MGNKKSLPVPIALIPPIIKPKFKKFDTPAKELLTDFFSDTSKFSASFAVSPQYRVYSPEKANESTSPSITTIVDFGATPPDQPKSTFGTGLNMTIEALWANNIRGLVRLQGNNTDSPKLGFEFMKESPAGTSGYFSVDPLPQARQWEAGLEHSSDQFSAGVATLYEEKTSQHSPSAWAYLHPIPGFSLGVDVRPKNKLYSLNHLQDVIGDLDIDIGVNFKEAISQISDRPSYDVSLKFMNNFKKLALTYYQHFSIRRKIYNPIEEKHITHITNYVDIATELVTEADKMQFAVAGSWQFNKCNMLKARFSNESAQGSYVFKTWSSPTLILAFNYGFNFNTQRPQAGFSIALETDYGGAEFDRVASNFEEGSVVRYGSEAAPNAKRFDPMTEPAPTQVKPL